MAYRRGTESLEKGDLDAAAVAFQEAVHHDPQAVQPLLGLATIALQRGETAAAEAPCDRPWP
jgi:Tfp pilus assembly protein PilF